MGPAKHHQFCLCPHLAKMCCLTSPFTKSCRQIPATCDHTWESGYSPLYSSFRLSNCPACPPSHRWETLALVRPGLSGSQVCFVCPAPKEQDPPWQCLCSRLQTEAWALGGSMGRRPQVRFAHYTPHKLPVAVLRLEKCSN